MHLLTKEISGTQEISVYEANQLYGEVGKYRYLQFSNEAIQGAIDLKDPSRVVMEYPRAIIHLMEQNNPAFEQVFMIGHGIGTIAGYFSNKKVTIAEVDEKVVELSRAFFHYCMDNVVIGDGRAILAGQSPGSFDYIVVDAFTKQGTPYHLTTLPFFEEMKEKLSANGAVIMNLMGKIKNDKLINAIHSTLREAFDVVQAFSLPAEDAADIRNIIVMGSSKAVAYDPRAMAGFFGLELEEGHRLMDKG